MAREVTEEDHSMVIATDGVWDMLSADRVATLLSSSTSNSASAIAKKIEQEAFAAWEAVLDVSPRKTKVTMTIYRACVSYSRTEIRSNVHSP